jgi:hypothetical protein
LPRKKAEEQKVKMWISTESYNLLANHSSHVGMTPDDLANLVFEYALSDETRLGKIIATIKQQKDALKVAV